MTSAQTASLYEAGKAGSFQVVSVPNIGLLENLGVRAGAQIRIQSRYAFGGPVLLCVEGAYSVAIGKDIAEQIEVISAAMASEEREPAVVEAGLYG